MRLLLLADLKIVQISQMKNHLFKIGLVLKTISNVKSLEQDYSESNVLQHKILFGKRRWSNYIPVVCSSICIFMLFSCMEIAGAKLGCESGGVNILVRKRFEPLSGGTAAFTSNRQQTLTCGSCYRLVPALQQIPQV